MPNSGEATPVITSISDLAGSCDVWFLDVWGVMHNGVSAFREAVEACQKFRNRDGYVLLLTNAPRPAAAVMEQLNKVGVPREAYDAVVTSGDVTRGVIEANSENLIYHIGPERDLGIFHGLNAVFTDLNNSGMVVCTGLINDEVETPDNYAATLQTMKHRAMTMLCANPDIKVERGSKIVYCAGAIAQAYEALGCKVIYSGKPYMPIYELALETAKKDLGKEISNSNVLAIGDGVKTDIKGAAEAGIRSVFIASGVHVDQSSRLTAEIVDTLFKDLKTGRPVAAMQALAW